MYILWEHDSPNKGFPIMIIVKNELSITSGLWIMTMAGPLSLHSPLVISKIRDYCGGVCRTETPMDEVCTIERQGFLKKCLAH